MCPVTLTAKRRTALCYPPPMTKTGGLLPPTRPSLLLRLIRDPPRWRCADHPNIDYRDDRKPKMLTQQELPQKSARVITREWTKVLTGK